MRSKVVLWTLLLYFSFSFSAQVSLTGTVTFSDGTTPAVGVTIAVPTGVEQVETTTDVLGNYSFSIEEGTYDELRVRNMGQDIDGIPNMMEFQAIAPLVVSGNTIVDVKLNEMPKISGTVKDAEGTLLPNAKVEVISWDGSMTQLPYDESNVAGDGTYKVWAETGEVKVTVRPPEGSPLPNYVFYFTHSKDTVLDISFPALLTLNGTVTSHKGDTIKGITVALVKDENQTETTTDSNGLYSFQLSEGTVTELRVRNMGQDIMLVPNMLEHTVKTNFEITADMVKDVVLPIIHTVSGTLYTSDSTILAGATVSSAKWDGNMNQLPSDESQTDVNGLFTLYIADGETQIKIRPPEGSGLADEEKIETFTSDTTYDIYLSKASVLSGKVLYYDSLPVSGITIALSNGQGQWETTTATDGSFQISVEPGVYNDFRIRSMGSNVDSIPNMLEYTVDSAGVDLTDSKEMDIILPQFVKLYGVITNSLEEKVPNITVRGNAWNNGMNGLPSDEVTTATDGLYELFLQKGLNQIILTNDGTKYSTAVFTIEMEENLEKNIILTDQAKGVGRIQPSVISQNKSGKVVLTGVNTKFTEGVTSIDLGEGITVTNIVIASDISLTAEIVIAEDAATGSRSIKVVGENETYIGAELFTVTAPVKESAILDSESRLKVTIIINDGTGTEIVIDSGTLVIFPDGVAPEIKFDAPIIVNDTVNPDSAKFLQIQREFSPSGVTFDPPAKITYHYQDQDVEGVNEDSLKAFKYDNEKDSVIGEYEIIEKDTANNMITQKAETFSLFRLAVAGSISPVIQKETINESLSLRTITTGINTLLQLYIPTNMKGKPLTVSLYSVSGRELYRYSVSKSRQGLTVLPIQSSKNLASGIYYLEMNIGTKQISKAIRIK